MPYTFHFEIKSGLIFFAICIKLVCCVSCSHGLLVWFLMLVTIVRFGFINLVAKRTRYETQQPTHALSTDANNEVF